MTSTGRFLLNHVVSATDAMPHIYLVCCLARYEMSQTAKAAWKTMCDGGYNTPSPLSSYGPVPTWWNGTFSNPSNAEDKAFRAGHRALRQIVLNSYTAAGTLSSNYLKAQLAGMLSSNPGKGQKTCSWAAVCPRRCSSLASCQTILQ